MVLCLFDGLICSALFGANSCGKVSGNLCKWECGCVLPFAWCYVCLMGLCSALFGVYICGKVSSNLCVCGLH